MKQRKINASSDYNYVPYSTVMELLGHVAACLDLIHDTIYKAE